MIKSEKESFRELSFFTGRGSWAGRIVWDGQGDRGSFFQWVKVEDPNYLKVIHRGRGGRNFFPLAKGDQNVSKHAKGGEGGKKFMVPLPVKNDGSFIEVFWHDR